MLLHTRSCSFDGGSAGEVPGGLRGFTIEGIDALRLMAEQVSVRLKPIGTDLRGSATMEDGEVTSIRGPPDSAFERLLMQ